MRLHISPGNSKIGDVPSLSFPPHVTCAPDVPCARQCYAYRVSRIRPTVRAAWQRNLDLWIGAPTAFRQQLESFLGHTNARRFRWFVAGDFPDLDFLLYTIHIAFLFPTIGFTAYTKRWKGWSDKVSWRSDKWPRNYAIRASRWPAPDWEETPAGMPWAAMIPKQADALPSSVLCPSDCGACGYQCWNRDVNVSIRYH